MNSIKVLVGASLLFTGVAEAGTNSASQAPEKQREILLQVADASDDGGFFSRFGFGKKSKENEEEKANQENAEADDAEVAKEGGVVVPLSKPIAKAGDASQTAATETVSEGSEKKERFFSRFGFGKKSKDKEQAAQNTTRIPVQPDMMVTGSVDEAQPKATKTETQTQISDASEKKDGGFFSKLGFGKKSKKEDKASDAEMDAPMVAKKGDVVVPVAKPAAAKPKATSKPTQQIAVAAPPPGGLAEAKYLVAGTRVPYKKPPPPPPSIQEIAAEYRLFVTDLNTISGMKLNTPSAVRKAYGKLSRHRPEVLATGWIANAAVLASQNPAFQKSLDQRIADEGRDKLLSNMARKPNYIANKLKSGQASKVVVSTVTQEVGLMHRLGDTFLKQAYTFMSNRYGMNETPGLSATPASFEFSLGKKQMQPLPYLQWLLAINRPVWQPNKCNPWQA